MADEGKASVKITADTRDFARDAEKDLNEALKKVKPDPVKVPVDQDAAGRAGEDAGESIARGASDGTTKQMRSESGRISSAGEKVGADLGDGAKRGFLKRFGGIGSALESALKGAGVVAAGALSGVASAVVPAVTAAGTAIGGTLIAAFAAVIGPGLVSTIGAAVTAAAGVGLGAGLIGLGALALKEVKPFQSALESLTKTFKDVAREAAKPLLKPLVREFGLFEETLRQLKPEWTSIFKSLAPALAPLNQAFGEFLGNITRGVKDSMPGIKAALEGFGNALPGIGQKIGDFFRTIFENKDLIDNTTEGFLNLVTGPLPLLADLISGLNVAFGVYNNLLRLMAEENVLGKIGNAILAFVDGGTGAIQRIKDAWGPLGDAIQNVWDKLKAFAAEDDAGKLSARFAEVVEAMKQAWGPLKNFIATVWQEAIEFVKRFWNEEFVPFWEETARPWLGQAIKGAFEMAWDAAIALVRGKLSQLVSAIGSWLGSLPGRIGGWLAGVPGAIGNVFVSASNRAISAILSFISKAVGYFRGLAGKLSGAMSNIKSAVTGVFSGAAGWLRSAGTNIINGLINGIRAGFGRVQSTLSSLTAMLPDWKGPAEVDKKILNESGRLVMQGFEDGLRNEFASVRSSLADFTGGLGSMTEAKAGTSVTNTTGAITFGAGAIVINAANASAGTAAAEAFMERLAQAALVR